MRGSVWIKVALLFIAGCAVVNGAMALECSGERDHKTERLNVQSLDVGPKVAVGSEVHRQRVKYDYADRFKCKFDNKDETLTLYSFPDGPFPLAIDIPGYERVYPTEVDGLGVAYINSLTGEDVDRFQQLKMADFMSPGGGKCVVGTDCKFILEAEFDVVLLKVGGVRAGKLTRLPTLLQAAIGANMPRYFYIISFRADTSIVSKTCLATPVEVNMGAHSTRVFTGIGSTAPPKDFSIELTNCPAFNGAGKKTLKFRIDPVLSAINASNGVLRLDASASTAGTRAASGVGVQIVTTKDSPLSLGKDQDSGLPLRSAEANYSIPLRARYLQTDSKVTPGPAKATANFTIIYE